MQGRNPVDILAAINQMRATEGWKILMELYAKEGDELITQILDVEIKNEPIYGLRDLYVHQLNALGRLGKVLERIETEAKVKSAVGKEPPHIGV